MLFFNNNSAQLLRRKVATVPNCARVAEFVIRNASLVLDEPVIERRFDDGRQVMLTTSRRMADRVHYLGVALLLTGESRFRKRLVQEMLAVAAFPGWNRVHFLDTAEMVAAVALGRDWTHDLLTHFEKKTLDDAILTHGLRPGLASLRGRSAWISKADNWNLVCCGGLIVAAVAMRPVFPAVCNEILVRAAEAMKIGLSHYDEAGGWDEGVSYWEYATRYAVLAFAACEHAGIDLLDKADFPGFLQSWRFGRAMIGPSGTGFDSGDNVEDTRRFPFYGWLTIQGGQDAAAEWQWASPGEPHPFDLIWPAKPSKALPEPATIEVFPSAGFVAIRTMQPQDGIYLALRLGANRTNHAHLDLGTFVLERSGTRFICDHGRGDYAAPGYFSDDRRYSYARTQTHVHNTILIDGKDQSLDAKATILAQEETAQALRLAAVIDDPEAACLHFRAWCVTRGTVVAVADRLVRRSPGRSVGVLTLVTKAKIDNRCPSFYLSEGEKIVQLSILGGRPADILVAPLDAADPSGRPFLRIAVPFTVETDRAIAVVVSREGEEGVVAAGQAAVKWLEEITDRILNKSGADGDDARGRNDAVREAGVVARSQ